MIKHNILLAAAALLLSGVANAYVFISAVPTSVRLVDGGLVLTGDFDLTGISCSTGPSAVFLPGSDTYFDRKLSVALTAYATGKQMEVMIDDPIASNCTAVSAIGSIATVHTNYWYLK